MEKDLENKFCLYVNNLAINNVRYSKFDEVKQTIDSFCNENNLQSKKVFTSRCIRKIFGLCDFWISITLDDAKKFLDEYLLDGEEISFMTLNSLMECMDPKVCGLVELRDFIETYVHQSKNHSELNEEIKFFLKLDSIVDLEPESLLGTNMLIIKFFSDWQSQIINMSNITDKNYMSINSLAIKLLEFKAKTDQYSGIKTGPNNIRNDVLSYIEKIVLSSKKQENLPDNILALYFNALLSASIGNKEYKQKVFNIKFIKRIKKKILGDDKKINNVYQMRFLIDILKLNYDLNRKSNLERNIDGTTKYQFDEAYNFIFGNQDKNEIKTIVSLIGDRDKKFIVKYFLLLIDLDSININSKSFRDFCEIFDLNIKEGQRSHQDIKPQSFDSEDVEQTIKNYLSGYFLEQNEIKVENIYEVSIENKYGSEIHIQTDSGEKKICDLKSCISKKDKQTSISCNINLSSYKKNSRAYEIFAAVAFLIFGFIPLIILKSVFDILFLPIKLVLNIFYSAFIAYKKGEYLWMFLNPIKEIFYGACFIIFSPIIFLYNNFCSSKYLFHKSGTGQKLITFNNWSFYKEQSDYADLKNFTLTEINLWFIIKYIFGFACLAKFKDSELKMEFKLTDNNQLKQESVMLKLSDKILMEYESYTALTNEYSPLSYLESIK